MFLNFIKRLFKTEVDRGCNPHAATKTSHVTGQCDKMRNHRLQENSDPSSTNGPCRSVSGKSGISFLDQNSLITLEADADASANNLNADSSGDESNAAHRKQDNEVSGAGQSANLLTSDTELPDLSKSDLDEVEPSPQPNNLPNATLFAARCLLRRMVAENVPNWNPGMRIEIPDIIIIEAAEIWLPALEDAIPGFFGERLKTSSTTTEAGEDADEDDDDDDRPRRRTSGLRGGYRHRRLDSAIAVYCQPVGKKEREASLIVELVGESLRQRKKVVVLTTDDPELTFTALRVAADVIWRLPVADDEWLGEFAEEITSNMAKRAAPPENTAFGGKISLVAFHPLAGLTINTDFDFSKLKLDTLQIALRQGQSAQNYVDQLKKLNANGTEVISKPALPDLTLDDLHGANEFVAWAKALALDLAEYKEGKIPWSNIDPGALLYGPPGTGKTTAAQAAALFCKVAFVATSYGEWQSHAEGHLGDVTRAIRDVFEEARKSAPCVLFIDEMDTIGSRLKKSPHSDWWRAIVNLLLGELDGVHRRDGVVVIGATNDPEAIDPAIRRAGRMDRQIEIPLPSREALAKIFRFYVLREVPDENWTMDASSNAQFERLAALSLGSSGADVARVVRNAKRHARSKRRSLQFDDLFQELLGSDADTKLSDSMRQRIAVHESGHALVRTLQKPNAPPTIRLGGAGNRGGSTSYQNDEYAMFTAIEIDETLVLMLAGRAAEEIICGSPSSGAGGGPSSDMARATMMATMAETNWGLGSVGLTWSNVEEAQHLDTLLAMRPGAATAVQHRLDVAYETSKRIITANRETVVRIAESLIANKILLPADVLRLVQANGSRTNAFNGMQ